MKIKKLVILSIAAAIVSTFIIVRYIGGPAGWHDYDWYASHLEDADAQAEYCSKKYPDRESMPEYCRAAIDAYLHDYIQQMRAENYRLQQIIRNAERRYGP